MFNNIILAITEKELKQVVQPLLEVLGVIVPVLLTVVGALGAVWVIFLGVKYAKAEDPQEHEKTRAALKNAIIGFILIFVLLIALQVAVGVFTSWYKNYEFQTY
jgi:succinate dehydrogenase/fumarate reductase cytochrome b subunit